MIEMIEMEYKIEQLEWKCLTCGEVAPGLTKSDYMQFIKHEKGHHIELVNKVTRGVIAKSPKGVHSKGIELPGIKPGGFCFELTEGRITLPVT